MRVVVTGGAGFIGSRLVDRLLAERVGEVVVLDNFVRGDRRHLAAHAHRAGGDALRVVEGDIRDSALLHAVFDGADVVHHLAAQSNVMGAVTDVDYSFTTNVVGTFNVLQAAHSCRVKRVVFTSSREVYGEVASLPVLEAAPTNAKNGYGASKAAGELYARVFRSTYGLDVAVLRLANVYGPRDRDRVIPLWLDAAAGGRDLLVYGGAQVLDFVWVDHVVEALVRAARDGVAYDAVNVGSGHGTPILDLASRLLEVTGSRSRVDLRPARSVEVTRYVADVGLMRAALGLTPPDDPLFALPGLWDVTREAASA
jgi:nucleoside-diphosphate-sugar epimerase